MGQYEDGWVWAEEQLTVPQLMLTKMAALL